MAGAIEGPVNYNWHIADNVLVGSKVRLSVKLLSGTPLRRASGIGATSPFIMASAKDRCPPDLVVREGDHGCRLGGMRTRSRRQG
jgi:hypothetical protein